MVTFDVLLQVDVDVETTTFADFRQGGESGSSTVNALGDIQAWAPSAETMLHRYTN